MTAGTRLSPTPDEVARDVVRVADRLRVIGPRLAARGTPQAGEVLDDVRAALQRLADLSTGAEGVPARPVPVLAEHALADQVLVIGHDAVSALAAGSGAQAAAGLIAVRDLLDDLRALL